MYSPDPALAHIYSTPHIHQPSSSDLLPNCPPIVSSIGTFSCNIARFLCNLLSPIVPNDYSSKNTFLLFFKLRMPIFPENLFFLTVYLAFLLIFYLKKSLILHLRWSATSKKLHGSTSAWVFSCEFGGIFRGAFSWEHL